MSREHELPSDSDDDDEDYVPNGVEEAVSEAESEGEAESGPEDENNENEQVASKRKGKKRDRGSKRGTKRRKNADEQEEHPEEEAEKKVLTEEEEKKRADSLWADFMKDTGSVSKPKAQNSTANGLATDSPVIRPKIEDKVKITKVFEFAGEEVRVEKEVSADSAEARLSLSSEKIETTSNDSPKPSVRGRGIKRGGLGGISSVLGQIGKKAKISTLEKSKLDWDNYKKAENIDEEITTHNRGKDGFLERQDFLQRADLRQFEIEKQLRAISRRSNR